MPQLSVLIGLALCGLTVFGMVGTAEKLATAFVPMMLGIPLVFCGIVSLNPHRRKAWMRVAGTVATLGFVTSCVRLADLFALMMAGEPVNRFVMGLLWGIGGLCGIFLACLAFDIYRSFRRRRALKRSLRESKGATLEAAVTDKASPSSDAPRAASAVADGYAVKDRNQVLVR